MRSTIAIAAVLCASVAAADDKPKFPEGLYPAVKVIPAVVRTRTVEGPEHRTHEVCFGECNDEHGFVKSTIIGPAAPQTREPVAPITPETSGLATKQGVPGIIVANP